MIELNEKNGAALVEFVLVLFILVGLMCAVIEVTMYFKDCATATMCARDGARDLAFGRTSTAAMHRVLGCDSTGLLTSSNVSFTYSTALTGVWSALPADFSTQNGVSAGYFVSCSVRKPHTWVTGLFKPIFPATANAQLIMVRD
jgi:Flp pilus assembly protein TadG